MNTLVINILTLVIIQQTFLSTYVPGPALETRGRVLSKMDMVPATSEFNVLTLKG